MADAENHLFNVFAHPEQVFVRGEGMWLIERKLRQILENEGLKGIDSLGEAFDPYKHEAVAHVESDAPEGTVITEHQKAYRLHDRVIRPAMVTVAKKKES